MDLQQKEQLINSWEHFFPGAELPIFWRYAESPEDTPLLPPPEGWRCLVAQLTTIRHGKSFCFSSDSITCRGGSRFTGYANTMPPGHNCFLSHAEDGSGERYIQTPEMADLYFHSIETLPRRGDYIIMKRLDALVEGEIPDVVCCFVTPDVLSGLFTLAQFERLEEDSVITPFGAGCSSLIYYPYRECLNGKNRAVIGLFDPSARKCIKENILSFSVPYKRFEEMAKNMNESFLITHAWGILQKRMVK